MPEPRLQPGLPYPLGSSWDGTGVNFALFSANAEKVELCLFDAKGRRELERIALTEYTHEVWHGYLADSRPGQPYGYRVYGPWDPKNGYRFNGNKLLIDPYAKALLGELRWHDACYGYRVGSRRLDLSFDRRDSAFVMPKSVVVDTAATWGMERKPDISRSKTVVYEAHVKGMTALQSDLPGHIRGTFAGMANPRVLDHLVKLGVTAVEIMPVQAFFDDRHLVEKGLANYWGYNTIAYFAPAPRYISPGENFQEFKMMVRRFHEADIEVILDVVYNHTAEGNHLGPTLSFRGIDNASYYMLADDPRYYFDATGCGNTVNLRHPRVLQMVMDSLRYWVEDFHVDGFRFDLASALGRDRDEFEVDSVFFGAVQQDPTLSRVKLIAEPWDLGQNGYQLGNFPAGWAEWNGRYRDDLRSFWNAADGMLPSVASGLLGSAGLFDHRGRRPWASVNFITAHDGFTLRDLYTYNEKHNEANGENNADGHDDNRSWNCGVEGETDDPAVLDLRDLMRRNLMATLMLSQGTPMILMGDEIGRTQHGNNNAYCQDNEITWLDLENPSQRDTAFLEFVSAMINLRHRKPLLRQRRFLHGQEVGPDGLKNVTWLGPDGKEMQPEEWSNGATKTIGMLLADRENEPVLVVLNASPETVGFHCPEHETILGWRMLVDTSRALVEPGEPQISAGTDLTLGGRSLLVLEGAIR